MEPATATARPPAQLPALPSPATTLMPRAARSQQVLYPEGAKGLAVTPHPGFQLLGGIQRRGF